jgi:hypothetical protein
VPPHQLLDGGIGASLYASTYRFSELFVGPTYDMAGVDGR